MTHHAKQIFATEAGLYLGRLLPDHEPCSITVLDNGNRIDVRGLVDGKPRIYTAIRGRDGWFWTGANSCAAGTDMRRHLSYLARAAMQDAGAA